MKLFIKISYAIAVFSVAALFIISLVKGWWILSILTGVFTLILSFLYKFIFKNETKKSELSSQLVYDRERDGDLK